MNATALRTFLSIVETGSLVAASKRLHVTQSTVTVRLQALEDELGQPLLLRQKSGVSLTPAGIKLKRYAEVMLDLWQQLKTETSLAAHTDSMCNIACTMDMWDGLGQRFFNRIHQDYPNVGLTAWPGSPGIIEQWLSTGLVDVAFSEQASKQSGVSTIELVADKLIVVSTDPNRSIKADPGYVYFDAGEEFGRRHTATYTDAGVAKISFGSSQWALAYLLENQGSAYLPLRSVRQHLAAGRLFHLSAAPTITRRCYFLYASSLALKWPWLCGLAEQVAKAANAAVTA